MTSAATKDALPEPALDADDAPLPDGEAVAFAVPLGAPVTLRFASPFEPWLTLDGARVVEDDGAGARDVLLWSGRRLAALWRALDERSALRGVWVAGSEPRVVVTDLVTTELRRRDDDDEPVFEWADHGVLRERLEPANVELTRFSVLGQLATRAELERKVRATYAPGTLVEIRVEDGRRVVARRRVRVGR